MTTSRQLSEIVAAVLGGTVSLRELEAWVESHLGLYKRPQNPVGLVDWYDRRQEAIETVNHLLAVGTQSGEPGEELLALQASYLLSRLLDDPRSCATPAFRTGYLLWQLGRHHEAAAPLREAAEGFARIGDRELELAALSFLSDALLCSKHFQETIQTADDLFARARASGFEGHAASALRDKGLALAALGDAEAVETLSEAVRARRSLDEETVASQSVAGVDRFLDALGRAARQAGEYDLAFIAFTEISELHVASGDHKRRATALSEIGYTYQQAGEPSRAAAFLDEAARLAAASGAAGDAQRWRAQVAVINGSGEPTLPTPQRLQEDSDERSAYGMSSRAELLLSTGSYREARQAAEEVVRWAQQANDDYLEMTGRGLLAIAAWKSGDIDLACESFQKAIYISDRLHSPAWAIPHHYNFAKALLDSKELNRAYNVIITGIAKSRILLSQSKSSESRQQIIAASAALFELYAFLLVHAKDRHFDWVSLTDLSRCQNLEGWLDGELKSQEAPPVHSGRLRELLHRLRGADIQIELRHADAQLERTDLESLEVSRRQTRSALEAALADAGLPRLAWDRDFSHALTGRKELLNRLSVSGTALLYLLSIPEGVCAAVLGPEPGQQRGLLVPWPREEREDLVRRYLKNPDTSSRELYDRFYRELAPLHFGFPPGDLVVVPHRELSAFSYWPLMDALPHLRGLSVAPNLAVHELCRHRQRSPIGPGVVVGDATGTLTYPARELQRVRKLASATNFVEVHNVEDLRESAVDCRVLHVASHGVFNAENPYLSGLLIGRRHDETGPSVRFLTADQRFSERPLAGSVRVFTVAECFAKLDLGNCALAVLSACETGLSRIHAANEMTGLPAALLAAGARCVVASLWRVSDAATFLLMRSFYSFWEGGAGKLPPRGALAQAREELRRTTRARAEELLSVHGVADEYPFAAPRFTDAFECFGAG